MSTCSARPLPSPARCPPSPAGPTASGPLGGKDLGMDIAALIAWLVTAGSGAYVLGSWISHGGSVRRRTGGTGSPPVVIIGHFSLALAGLVIWVAYMVVGWAALAWTAVGVLSSGGRTRHGRTGHRPSGAAQPSGASRNARSPPLRAASLQGGTATGGIGTGSPSTGTTVGTGTTASAGDPGRAASSGQRRLSPLVVVGHGAVAVATMLLVLLAALGAGLRLARRDHCWPRSACEWRAG